MKTKNQYEQEIADLKELIKKLKISLTKALGVIAENHRKERDLEN